MKRTAKSSGSSYRKELALLIGLAMCFISVAVLTKLSQRVPAAEGGYTSGFSAERAVGVGSVLQAANAPHGVDSAASALLRNSIIDALRSSGYTPEVQEVTSCYPGTRFVCATVHNISATLAGTEPGKLLMVSAHYDSVWAGPGISDDTSGVMVLLEIARMLRSAQAARHGVLFLFTDGEESGLLGARAFVQKDPRRDDIAAVINLEARGTTGQSVLFETGSASGWLIRAFGRSASRPSANSAVSALYRLMPNDTDLSVFKERGISGVNFAFAEGDGRYHTSLDNLANLDRRSLQQQGANAYELLNAVRSQPFPEHTSSDEPIYLDLFTMAVFSWSKTTAWVVLACATLIFFLVHRRSMRCAVGQERGGVRRGFALTLLAPVTAGLTAYLLSFGLARTAGGMPAWHTDMVANRILLWIMTLLVTLTVLRTLARNSRSTGLWYGTGYAWMLLTLVALLALPGTSYLFMLPSAGFSLAALWMSRAPPTDSLASGAVLLPAMLGFVPLLQLVYLIEIMLGYNSTNGVVVSAALLGLMATAATPLLARTDMTRPLRYLTGALGFAIVASGTMAVIAPAYGPANPRIANIFYIQDRHENAFLASSESDPPPSMRRVLGGGAAMREVLPEEHIRLFATSVPSAGLTPARLSVVETHRVAGGTKSTLELAADPDTYGVEVVFPPTMQLKSIQTDGQTKDYAAVGHTSEAHTFVCLGKSCDRRRLAIVFSGVPAEPITLHRLTKLPGAASALVDARNKDAVPRQDGDLAVVVSQVSLGEVETGMK